MAKYFLLLVTGFFLSIRPSISQTADSVQLLAASEPPQEVKYFMVLDKPGHIHRIRFYAGNSIAFKLHGERGRYNGQITAIKKHSIVLWDAEIPIRDIQKIKIIRSGGAAGGINFLGRLLQGAGGLFTIVSLSNYALDVEYGDDSLEFLKYTVSAMVVGSVITRTSRNRTYKINQNRRLKTIEQFW
jgi:hypothetical protein